MTFLWPVMLWLLLALPLLVMLYLRLQSRRAQLAARYGNLGLTQTPTGRALARRRHLPPALFLSGLALLVIALARPQMVVSLPKQEGLVILAFDVSGSMAATDMMPNRMEAAKAAVRDFVQRQPTTVQIGVVAFSDSSFAVQTPTDDQAAILAAIDRLAPTRGTSLGQGMLTALNVIAAATAPEQPQFYSNLTPAPTPSPTPVPPGVHTPAVIVLLTDGENTDRPDPFSAAQMAADRGVRVYTVGIGRPEGAIIEVEGFSLQTNLDEATLRQIAEFTGGQYFNAAIQQDLQTIYDNLDPQFVLKPELLEITSILAGLSLAVFVLGGAFSLRWFGHMP